MKKTRSVFISRDLSEDSPLTSILKTAGLKVSGQSLIQFSLLAFESLPDCDWIFFYSSNGVRYFFQGLEELQCHLPEQIQLAAMGKGTGRALKSLGYSPDFIGDGKPDATARFFLQAAESQRVLFARAFNSAKSVQNLLAPYINIIDLPVYKNEIKKDLHLPEMDYVILTSSMNVDAYFQQKTSGDNKTYIAIGKPTALRYARWIEQEVYIPDAPSEKALARLVLDLEKKAK